MHATPVRACCADELERLLEPVRCESFATTRIPDAASAARDTPPDPEPAPVIAATLPCRSPAHHPDPRCEGSLGRVGALAGGAERRSGRIVAFVPGPAQRRAGRPGRHRRRRGTPGPRAGPGPPGSRNGGGRAPPARPPQRHARSRPDRAARRHRPPRPVASRGARASRVCRGRGSGPSGYARGRHDHVCASNGPPDGDGMRRARLIECREDTDEARCQKFTHQGVVEHISAAQRLARLRGSVFFCPRPHVDTAAGRPNVTLLRRTATRPPGPTWCGVGYWSRGIRRREAENGDLDHRRRAARDVHRDALRKGATARRRWLRRRPARPQRSDRPAAGV